MARKIKIGGGRGKHTTALPATKELFDFLTSKRLEFDFGLGHLDVNKGGGRRSGTARFKVWEESGCVLVMTYQGNGYLETRFYGIGYQKFILLLEDFIRENKKKGYQLTIGR